MGIDMYLEKPKAAHEMIGFRINNLELPPYLGVELVFDDWRRVEGILRSLPRKDGIILKAGAPLIKRYGVEVCQKIHQLRPESVLIADMKTLDTGNLEARMGRHGQSPSPGWRPPRPRRGPSGNARRWAPWHTWTQSTCRTLWK